MRNIITDNLSDIECHAGEWTLPTSSSTDFSQSRCSSAGRQTPSPLIHDKCKGAHLPTTHCLLLCCSCSKRSCSEETSGGRSPYIPIPKRIRKHRRTDSNIMIRLTDSEFEFAPDGTVLIKKGRYINSLILAI